MLNTIEIRNQELNRYEIRDILLKESEESKEKIVAPSASTIYNIIRRHGLSKLNKPQKEQKRKIIMSKIGELVHIDCHQLSKGIVINNNDDDKTYYLLGIIDDYSRIAWAEVIDNKKALTVMFATLKAFNILNKQYNIQIDRVMTDNGAEFGGGKNTKNKEDHPFERLLLEMDMKHTYTRPYHPQTNGKIERFWKTLNEDFIEDARYNDIEDLKNELIGFLVYYNEHRPHSGIGNIAPINMINKRG